MPPAIYGPPTRDLILALVDARIENGAWGPDAPVAEMAAARVARERGWDWIRRQLGCAPIHEQVANSWPLLSLRALAA